MTKIFYLSLLLFSCLSFSINAQNLTDNPANYQQTAPLSQLTKGLPISTTTTTFRQIDTTVSTVLCDSGTVSLVGTGVLGSSWSTDYLGTNVITTTDTFTSGLLTSDTSFYHTSITDSLASSPVLAAQTGIYTGAVRGYSFVSPIDMLITGFWVPTDASTGVQHVEFLRFRTAITQYPDVTNDFNVLGTWRNYNALDTIFTNIQVYAGDTLGIYGNRANANSYAPNTSILINGILTPIFRSGMQIPISTNPMQDVFYDSIASTISRVEFFYTANSDTIITTHNITVSASSTSAQTFTACNGDSVTYNSVNYGTDTVLVNTLTNSSGCDSVVTTTIIIEPAIVGSLMSTICTGDSVVVNGTTYNAANPTGSEVFTAVNGCDSTVSINLTVIPVLTGNMMSTICTGDSVVINGTTYNAANPTGSEVLTSINGCDSTVSINLMVVPVLTGNMMSTICTGDSIVVNGTTYNAANPTGSEVLTSIDGCDSTVSINLTILPVLTGNMMSTICTGDSVVVNGTTYNAANPTGSEVFTAANGCDSTVSVNLTILPALTGTYLDTICAGDSVVINGTTYNVANPTGSEVFTAANGCDSTVSINLGVQSINNSTTLSGLTITANQTGATYQWVDCNNSNAPILGETNSSYTAISNGDYAVVLTMGSCSEMSNCVNITGLNTGKIQSETAFSIYPNPTSGQFTVALDAINTPTTIRIFDVLGQRILTQEVQSTKTQINLNNYSNGTYFIEVNNQKSVSVNKLILNK